MEGAIRTRARAASLLVAAATLAAPAGAQDAAAPPAEVALFHAIASEVSADRIEADVRTLVGFGTRHTLSDTRSDTRGIGAARRWAHAQFDEISADCGGCLEVIDVADVVEDGDRVPEPTEIVSVLAIQRGTIDPGRMVMMSAHIDSRASDVMDAAIDAPGANDDASGVAGVLEAARVLSKRSFPGTIVYAALSGEEQGLYGGAIVAAHAKAEGWRLKAVLNNDIIGNIEGQNGVVDNATVRVFSEGVRAVETPQEARDRRYSGGEIDSASRNIARYLDHMADVYLPNLDVRLIYRLDRFGRGGDHSAFNDAGFPGVRLTEANENYARQHQDVRVENGIAYGDVLAGVDPAYAAKVTALDAVALAGLASAPPFPADVTIEGEVSPSTTLRWTAATGPEAANLAGYKIYWRLTTSPEWTWSRSVGNVDQYTLENVTIDDYAFGVASVAADGAESPVVFPGATGSFGD